MSKYIKQADIGRGGSCHLFRHTCATHMLENGADIRFIQQLLGHEKLETTQIYTEVSIKQLLEVHARTHPAQLKGSLKKLQMIVSYSTVMTIALKEIVGELSGLSAEKQQVAASVIHALWNEEHAEDAMHPEWEAELDRRNTQIENGEVQLVDESSMNAFVSDLLKDEA